MKLNDQCLACGSLKLTSSLNLGQQPLANSYLIDSSDYEERYPLAVNVCQECFHVQLTHTVDPEIIYKNYLYVSGTSKTIQDYCSWFADYTTEYANLKNGSVLDIGCNDGTQLNYFADIGFDTWGVDPAENLHSTSSKRHNVVCDFFGPNLELDQQFDIISAQNVFAHNPTPIEFLSVCKRLMKDNTLLFIQTSQADMILNNEFDTIYHEHINFFNSLSMKKLAERCQLNLIDVVKTTVHGNSYIFVLSKSLTRPANIKNILDKESKLYDLSTYTNWEATVKSNMDKLITVVEQHKQLGYKIIGYGAAAKGNTMLNYTNLKLDLIVDDNPLKQGLLTPGIHIPIVSLDKINTFNKSDKILYMPLAWNFFKEIQEKILSVRRQPQDVFLKYFPTVEVTHV
jgi:SAM-dependent methyltransferase